MESNATTNTIGNLTLIVREKNIYHTIVKDKESQYSSSSNPECATDVTFPTNIKYIFEDDEEHEKVIGLDTTSLGSSKDTIENVIVVQLDENGAFEDVDLISENYILLDVIKSEDTVDENKNISRNHDIELQVLSKFRDLSPIANDLPLDDMISLYRIQNEQIETICNSL
ncbi:hypothetical protein NCAS_0A10440 [Naumovozyma castellii]|uniref:Autophagy-related protein 31 n=1 Tax=Naumovozyma castellii TaxID=27288 RepID=G0V804_NAUCA|nr:hypothetical protein NCAS_0A10440 [Naumovozyma castellii CBS 4309]CCC67602.1 hypothetical protein NCAS_0A10440 [Naumovozyma castellii CBS 4309]